MNLVAPPQLARDALDCYAADEMADNQHRAAFLKEMGDHDSNKAPIQHVPMCYVIDNIGVLMAYHVPSANKRIRPYIMICHLYVARGHRHQGHAGVMLHMLKEYALTKQVSTIRLGQGIRENAETVDFWIRIGFSHDVVKSRNTERLLMDEDLDLAFFGQDSCPKVGLSPAPV